MHMFQDFLRKIPLFEGLSDDDLSYLSENVRIKMLKQGEFLFEEGDQASEAYIIKSGKLEILKSSHSRQVLIAVRDVGEIIGEVALFQDISRTASVRARTETELVIVDKKILDEMISRNPESAHSIIHTILSRFNSTEAMLKNTDKLVQLGTLSAGLAHELNNPSSAIVRSSSMLEQALDDFFVLEEQIDRLDLQVNKSDLLFELLKKVKKAAKSPPEFDILARSDAENEMEEFLEEIGIEEAYIYAPAIVNLQFGEEELQLLTENFSEDELGVIVQWLEKSYTVYSLQQEITEGARRVSAIVKALKEYTYLDKAPLQEIDIHEGIENTLIIMKNKLKYNIKVERQFADNIPKIQAYGSELNQVWTNLIDNSADALMDIKDKRQPIIRIRTKLKTDWIVVEIEDNGPGMSESVQEKIFNPFFTTKPPGKGTGLGLDISYNIVAEKHRGDIKVFSRPETESTPGLTCFQVYLPIDLDRIAGKSVIEEFILPPDEELLDILDNTKSIAVVNIGSEKGLANYDIPLYLENKGFEIYAIHDHGHPDLPFNTFSSLQEIPVDIDLTLVFPNSKNTIQIVNDSVVKGVKYIWMQEGMINEEAALMAKNQGLKVVMDTCIRVTHKRLTSHED